MLLAAIAFGLQAAPSRTDIGSLAGKWLTTVAPRPGEAPNVDPSFTLEVRGDKVFAGIGSEPETEATVFRDGAEILLILKPPPTRIGGSRMIILRRVAPDELRFELFVEYVGMRSRNNFYYAELFRRSPK